MSEEEKTLEKEASLPQGEEALRQALEAEKARAESYLDGWRRAQADFQNLKRRTEQEQEEAKRFANAMLILNLLPIVDDLERAFTSLSVRLAGFTWVEGVRLIYRKLVAALEAHGLAAIAAMGKPFDPNFHEAVSYQEGAEGVVLEEVQRGYTLNGRVIRPTLVVVGKGKEKPAPEPGTPQEEAKDG